MLKDHKWKLKYTLDDGDLVRIFYVPALKTAKRYHRLTGYFSARALELAARGIEGLVRNDGHMKLIVGCTLDPPEIDAITKGEQLRDLVERRLTSLPLDPPDVDSTDALELLAWMVGRGILDVKVAVPCDGNGTPIPDNGIFHEKSGIIEDDLGDRIAWTGSLNETGAGWQTNWETISVYTSWGPEPGRVTEEEESFSRVWSGHTGRVKVLNVPEAVRRDLMRFMPNHDRPKRLENLPMAPGMAVKPEVESDVEASLPMNSLRDRVWAFIRDAPSRPGGGERIGEATAPVEPWPHQIRAFDRLYRNWPPKLLIADEVGLGKTIQAGLLLRQAWLARRAKRILILAPKAVLRQWQIELREKFNLNWPIYDGRKLSWYPSPALRGNHEHVVDRDEWHREPVVIASSQLMRRKDRASALLEQAEPWDLVVLDEAHHARRRGAGSTREGGPNTLLRLIQGLREKTQGLLLLTATPMQVHPIEVWDLLNLLGLPSAWSGKNFLQFFDDAGHPNPSRDAWERLATLFQSVERTYGEVSREEGQRIAKVSPMKTGKILRALRAEASIPRRQLEADERRAAIAILKMNTPIRRLVSRHTRELLRRYHEAGMLSTQIASRVVEDRFLDMTAEERLLYDAVEDYISNTYEQAGDHERSAVGFVMTVYRRRLASSFFALRKTLKKRRNSMLDDEVSRLAFEEEDLPDDDLSDETIDLDAVEDFQSASLAKEQRDAIDVLLNDIARLPPDSKLNSLLGVLDDLRDNHFMQVMVFTQFSDTMDFLREELTWRTNLRLLCFSGRGGEVPGSDGTWRQITRDDAKRRFRDRAADILICTDAAAEGLNFQFCGALVNYDMPWNPMRVEQRIGRIDRLGQEHPTIRIVNLHYENTVETDVYRAVRKRINLFETVVGPLQPILSKLPGRISETVLRGRSRGAREYPDIVDVLIHDADEHGGALFDIDEVTDTDLEMPAQPQPTVTMEDLDRIIRTEELMPPSIETRPLERRVYAIRMPGMHNEVRITSNTLYYEEHSESVELWSPGCPMFVPPEYTATREDDNSPTTLADLLDGK
ncbi:MAG: SNF2-related protein [bacterium]|nr:SNF2-related protein [bacterium]